MELTGERNDEATGKNEREKKKKEKDVEEEERREKKSLRENEGMRKSPSNPFSFSDRKSKWHRLVSPFSLLVTHASSVHSFPCIFLLFPFDTLLSRFDLMGSLLRVQ